MTSETVGVKIRDLPKEVHELMKERAKRHFRSLNGQIIADLKDASDKERAIMDAAGAEYAKQQEEGAE